MARRAHGFVGVKEFAHKPKVRRNARPKLELQANQRLKMSPWDQIENVSLKVDRDRANWHGIAAYSFDPTPRLNKRGCR